MEIPSGGANGVILAQGGRFGGWSLYVKDGKPSYAYNWVGLQRYTVTSDALLPSGKCTIKLSICLRRRWSRLFHTGYTDMSVLDKWPDVLVLRKPATPAEFMKAIASVVDRP